MWCCESTPPQSTGEAPIFAKFSPWRCLSYIILVQVVLTLTDCDLLVPYSLPAQEPVQSAHLWLEGLGSISIAGGTVFIKTSSLHHVLYRVSLSPPSVVICILFGSLLIISLISRSSSITVDEEIVLPL